MTLCSRMHHAQLSAGKVQYAGGWRHHIRGKGRCKPLSGKYDNLIYIRIFKCTSLTLKQRSACSARSAGRSRNGSQSAPPLGRSGGRRATSGHQCGTKSCWTYGARRRAPASRHWTKSGAFSVDWGYRKEAAAVIGGSRSEFSVPDCNMALETAVGCEQHSTGAGSKQALVLTTCTAHASSRTSA